MIDKETGEEWHFEHLRSAEDAYEKLAAENERLLQLLKGNDGSLKCTCHLAPCDEDDPRADLSSETAGLYSNGWTIIRCPLHAAAPDMWELVEILASPPWALKPSALADKARAIKRKVEG